VRAALTGIWEESPVDGHSEAIIELVADAARDLPHQG
jgi:hypothetical protein